MALMDLLKKIPVVVSTLLPKPIFPQKRYILLAVGLIYMGAHYYVQHTPDKYDDEVLEQVHKIAMELLAESQPHLIIDVDGNPPPDDNQQTFGERT